MYEFLTVNGDKNRLSVNVPRNIYADMYRWRRLCPRDRFRLWYSRWNLPRWWSDENKCCFLPTVVSVPIGSRKIYLKENKSSEKRYNYGELESWYECDHSKELHYYWKCVQIELTFWKNSVTYNRQRRIYGNWFHRKFHILDDPSDLGHLETNHFRNEKIAVLCTFSNGVERCCQIFASFGYSPLHRHPQPK